MKTDVQKLKINITLPDDTEPLLSVSLPPEERRLEVLDRDAEIQAPNQNTEQAAQYFKGKFASSTKRFSTLWTGYTTPSRLTNFDDMASRSRRTPQSEIRYVLAQPPEIMDLLIKSYKQRLADKAQSVEVRNFAFQVLIKVESERSINLIINEITKFPPTSENSVKLLVTLWDSCPNNNAEWSEKIATSLAQFIKTSKVSTTMTDPEKETLGNAKLQVMAAMKKIGVVKEPEITSKLCDYLLASKDPEDNFRGKQLLEALNQRKQRLFN